MDLDLEVKSTWRYMLRKEYVLHFNNHMGLDFESEWLSVKDSCIRIKTGYAWNGCDPAFRIAFKPFKRRMWIGTPDGFKRGSNGRPVTWEASLVHDAFCQYRKQLRGVTKDFTVITFKELLIKNNAPSWMVFFYPKAIHHFGPQEWQ